MSVRISAKRLIMRRIDCFALVMKMDPVFLS